MKNSFPFLILGIFFVSNLFGQQPILRGFDSSRMNYEQYPDTSYRAFTFDNMGNPLTMKVHDPCSTRCTTSFLRPMCAGNRPEDNILKKYFFKINETTEKLNQISSIKELAQSRFLEDEKEKNKQIATRLSLFTFMFFLSLLVASALNESGFLINSESDVVFLCHFELFFFCLLSSIFLLYRKKLQNLGVRFTEMNLLFLVLIFLIVLVPSVIFTSHNPKLIPMPFGSESLFYLALPVVLLIASLPFVVLYIRYRFYIPEGFRNVLAPYSQIQAELLMKLDSLIEIGTIDPLMS